MPEIDAKKFGDHEKTYYITEENYDDFYLFMNEVDKRKRGAKITEGLQASMVMFSDIVLAKVNENDGLSPHFSTQINLVKSYNSMNNISIDRIACLNKLSKDGVEVRFICTTKEILLIVYTKNRNFTKLEIKCIKEMHNKCNDYYKEGLKIDFLIKSKDYSIELTDWNEETFSKGLEEISNMENDLIKKR